ncbi:fibroblast growth factor 21 [Gadus chalcogrammus]|uniref:fibroblast growth factor 21 n=1 Tax=Gadus chalcogrammus TaxID=1042646 RepID=UPI0024C476D9|nr:fibroblast growth factor 21 [Gadus chalcogrammus]
MFTRPSSPLPSTLLLLATLLQLGLSFYVPDSGPLLWLGDQVRERHLYTESHRRGLFLEMSPDGQVTGSAAQTPLSVLELRSVRAGDTVIRARLSSLYLCVDRAGHLTGQRQYTESDCTFREVILEDGYTHFLSVHHRLPISLAPRHSPGRQGLRFSRFLPLRSSLSEERVAEAPQTAQALNLDSEDPLGMGLGSLLSPAFSMDT